MFMWITWQPEHGYHGCDQQVSIHWFFPKNHHGFLPAFRDSVADGSAVFCSRRVALVAVVAERQVSAAEGTGPGGLQPGPQGGPRGLGVLARTSFNVDVYI